VHQGSVRVVRIWQHRPYYDINRCSNPILAIGGTTPRR
jgi:hypothetical protein